MVMQMQGRNQRRRASWATKGSVTEQRLSVVIYCTLLLSHTLRWAHGTTFCGRDSFSPVMAHCGGLLLLCTLYAVYSGSREVSSSFTLACSL
jgi:hypothetical protein